MPDDEKTIQGTIVPDSEEKKAFIKGLLDNHQAARPLPDGSLPPGATHEIVGEAHRQAQEVQRVLKDGDSNEGCSRHVRRLRRSDERRQRIDAEFG